MISRTNGSGASTPLKLATPPARFDVESTENGRPVNLQLEGGGDDEIESSDAKHHPTSSFHSHLPAVRHLSANTLDWVHQSESSQ
jgi:hypothetical protein